MGLLTARVIFLALNACLWLSAPTLRPEPNPDTATPWDAARYVTDCQPCAFPLKAGGAKALFTFEIKTSAEGRLVQAIDVKMTDKKQHLPVANMVPLAKDEQFFFGGVDLNGDGVADLMLITSSGAANAYASYWLFDTVTASYKAIGTYPVLQVDPTSHRLKTYERGGEGGMIHDAKEYEFEGKELVLLREERESVTRQHGVFKQVIRERDHGVMKTVSEKLVHGKAE